MKEEIYSKLQDKKFFRALIEIKNGLPFPPKYSRLLTTLDYFFTRMKRDISINEYFYNYRFYKLNRNARKEYFTNDEFHTFAANLNGVSTIKEFKDKACFNRIFTPFIHRDNILAENVTLDEFNAFLSRNDSIIFKPNDSSMGRGVFKLSGQEALSRGEAFYTEMKQKRYVCEKCVVACDEIQALHPASLNTFRVVTYYADGEVKVLWSFIRIGRNNSVVDNAHNGGLFAMIDSNTGLICTPAKNLKDEDFFYHPDTYKQITGIIVPYWDKVIQTAKDAALHFPQATISGWDIALLQNGETELIEGNSKPDIDFVQGANGGGMKKYILKACQKQ